MFAGDTEFCSEEHVKESLERWRHPLEKRNESQQSDGEGLQDGSERMVVR